MSSTTHQDLFDRWLSEAIATKANTPTTETKVLAEHRRTKIKILLDCAAQLQCVSNLPGMDPRDPGGLDEHFNRIADRAQKYDRGDWVITDMGNLAIIHDRSDRSPGNYRGSIIAGNFASMERTIQATEIKGLAPDDQRLKDAKELVRKFSDAKE